MSKEMYLVVLEGQGDMDVKLIGPDTWAWINQQANFPQGKSGWNEPIPAGALKEMQEAKGDMVPTHCYITIGSWENDRALFAHGKNFDSVKDMMKHCLKENIELADEYHGCIY